MGVSGVWGSGPDPSGLAGPLEPPPPRARLRRSGRSCGGGGAGEGTAAGPAPLPAPPAQNGRRGRPRPHFPQRVGLWAGPGGVGDVALSTADSGGAGRGLTVGPGAMAGVQQGEKQLFEKFWRGTFKAVATPRPESIIVASITARKPLPR